MFLMNHLGIYVMNVKYMSSAADVDSPADLEASNIQTESATLTWKAPRAQISGYILTYESADGKVRVSKACDKNFFRCFIMLSNI